MRIKHSKQRIQFLTLSKRLSDLFLRKILSHFVTAPLQRSLKNPRNIFSICFHIQVEQVSMLVIQNDTLQPILYRDTITPMATMFFTRWDSMHSVFRLRTMLSRLVLILLSQPPRILAFLLNNFILLGFHTIGIE